MIRGSYQNGFAPRDGMPLYSSLWRGCVGAWAPCLGPTGLVLRDWSGYRGDGTVNNAAISSFWAVSGQQYANVFDGTNDNVTLPSTSPLDIVGGDFTVVFWMAHTTGPVNNAILFELTANSNKVVLTGGFGGSAFSLGIADGVTYTAFASSRDLNIGPTGTADGVWRQYAIRKRGTITLIVSGVSYSYTSDGFGPNSSTANKINGSFACSMDDVRVYNRALSDAELILLRIRRGIAYDLAPFAMPYSEQGATAARLRRLLLLGVGS